jgi:anti-sigma factor RsiW
VTQCSEIEVLLGPFADGELEPHQMREVARHLAQCGNCESALSDYEAAGRVLRESSPQPSLDNFTAAVMARLPLRSPIRARVREYLGSFNERLVAAMALASASLAIGAFTALLFEPYARDIVQRSRWATPAAAIAQAKAETPKAEPASLARNSHAVISRLESEVPSVAVWSEPRDDTTVIWVPDVP